jgi:aryl sulfotransferase
VGTEARALPQKTRELHNHHFDSTAWNDFRFRDDDVIVATYGKSGTTWMQQFVGQRIFNGDENVNVGERSPWMDLRVPPKAIKLAMVEAQTHRRVLKTHLAVDALVFSSKAGCATSPTLSRSTCRRIAGRPSSNTAASTA